MADLTIVAWAMLKWLFICSLITLIAFRQPIFTLVRPSSRTKPQSTKDKPIMDPRTERAHEIYHIVFLLQQRLVRDVIPAILEHADLYECTTSETRFYPILRISERQAPKELLVCEIPRPQARVLRPVRAIIFRINSHDQGYASDRDAGNWTWFTAQKLLTSAGDRRTSVDDGSTAAIVSEQREIFRNPMASSQWFTHEVVWRADSDNPAEAQWVSSMEAGERFAVHAWAKFPGWMNHVSDISVRVYTVAVA